VEEAFVEAAALQFYGTRGFKNEPGQGCHTLVLRKGLSTFYWTVIFHSKLAVGSILISARFPSATMNSKIKNW